MRLVLPLIVVWYSTRQEIEYFGSSNFSHENEIIKSVWFMFKTHFSFHSVLQVKVKTSLYLISKTDVQRSHANHHQRKLLNSCALMTDPQTLIP